MKASYKYCWTETVLEQIDIRTYSIVGHAVKLDMYAGHVNLGKDAWLVLISKLSISLLIVEHVHFLHMYNMTLMCIPPTK